jgi:predicted nucleic-acid-binding Zn-ribbon protein
VGKITKPGTPLYVWEDVTFRTQDNKWLIVTCVKIEHGEFYLLEPLLKKINMPTVTGTSDKDRAAKVCRAIWEYLINNGLFPLIQLKFIDYGKYYTQV